MKNRVYYGEYTLKYWLELMMDRMIELPDYQRFFVWKPKQVEALIEAIREDRFVPPITIGHFRTKDGTKNLIIDGQQRLTSILLARFGVIPGVSCKRKQPKFANGSSEGEVDDVSEWPDLPKEWKYSELLDEKHSTFESVAKKCENPKYSKLKVIIDDEFLAKHYLGFAYVIPGAEDEESQQQYYAKEFRALNAGGSALSPVESRRSLYYLKRDLAEKFEPEFVEGAVLKSKSKDDVPEKLDFVRCCSLLAQYAENNSADAVARGFKTTMETYYENFICAVTETGDAGCFGVSAKKFKDFAQSPAWVELKGFVEYSHYDREYQSIIDMDTNFFGLFYWMIYKGKKIDRTRIAALTMRLDVTAASFRAKPEHKRSPAALTYLRDRIRKSIEIYRNFLSA